MKYALKLKNTVIGDLLSLTKFQVGFLSLLITAMVWLSLYWGESTLGIFSGVTGILCVFLVNMRKISNYFWGVLNASTYGWLAYQAAYYGDTMLNIGFYLPIQFIGAYFWYKNMDEGSVVSRKLSIKAFTVLSVITILLTSAYSSLLSLIGGSLAGVDATTTTLSILATILMVKGYREQWVVWIVVNILSIFMWVHVVLDTGSNGIGILIMWGMYLANSIYGAYTWFKVAK